MVIGVTILDFGGYPLTAPQAQESAGVEGTRQRETQTKGNPMRQARFAVRPPLYSVGGFFNFIHQPVIPSAGCALRFGAQRTG